MTEDWPSSLLSKEFCFPVKLCFYLHNPNLTETDFVATLEHFPAVSLECGVVWRKAGFKNGSVLPCIKQYSLILEYR